MGRKIYIKKILPIREQLHALAWRMLGNEYDAEDAVQEVMLRLWSAGNSLRAYDNPAAYATTMCKNLCLDKIKLKKYNEEIDNQQNLSNSEDPYSLAERKEAGELIRVIISKLPNLQRLIIEMKDIEGYEVAEIAEITGGSIDSIRMNLSRARKKVREEYLKLRER